MAKQPAGEPDWLSQVKIEKAEEQENADTEQVNLTIKVVGRRRRDWWVDRGKKSLEGTLSAWVVAKLIEEFGEPPEWY